MVAVLQPKTGMAQALAQAHRIGSTVKRHWQVKGSAPEDNEPRKQQHYDADPACSPNQPPHQQYTCAMRPFTVLS